MDWSRMRGHGRIDRMTPRIAALALVLLVGLTPGAGAQEALYHGVLTTNPAKGILGLATGNATLKVPRFRFDVNPDDPTGIFPDKEPVLVAMGDETFRVPLPRKASRNGKVFLYRAKPPVTGRSIKMIRLTKRKDGGWDVRFTLQGVDLSALFITDPICKPLAVILGD